MMIIVSQSVSLLVAIATQLMMMIKIVDWNDDADDNDTMMVITMIEDETRLPRQLTADV